MHFHWALSTWAVVASAAEVRHRDGVHRIPKETPDTSTADWRILARAAQSTQLVCANGYSLCPQSLSGGCCAPGYACASDACTATTSGPTTCQGTVGAYACPASLQGGCCSLGYICQAGAVCIPPATATPTYTCPTNHYMCASSFGFGCCESGYGCATNSCYSTAPSTDISIQTTTNSKGSTVISTITSIITPSYTSAAGYPVTQEKYIPSTVAKALPVSTVVSSATSTSTSQNEPLSTGAIIGISIGALATTVFIVCAFLVTCGVWNIADSVHKTAKHMRVMIHSGRASRHARSYHNGPVGGDGDGDGDGNLSGSAPTYPNMSNSADATLISSGGRTSHRGHRNGESVAYPLMAAHQRTISDDSNVISPYDQTSDYLSSARSHSARGGGRRLPNAPWLSRQNQQHGGAIERPSHPRNFSVDSSATPSTAMASPVALADMNPMSPVVVHMVTEEIQEMPLVHDNEPMSPTNIGDREVIGQYEPVDQTTNHPNASYR